VPFDFTRHRAEQTTPRETQPNAADPQNAGRAEAKGGQEDESRTSEVLLWGVIILALAIPAIRLLLAREISPQPEPKPEPQPLLTPYAHLFR